MKSRCEDMAPTRKFDPPKRRRVNSKPVIFPLSVNPLNINYSTLSGCPCQIDCSSKKTLYVKNRRTAECFFEEIFLGVPPEYFYRNVFRAEQF